jgi:hypothetical protein
VPSHWHLTTSHAAGETERPPVAEPSSWPAGRLLRRARACQRRSSANVATRNADGTTRRPPSGHGGLATRGAAEGGREAVKGHRCPGARQPVFDEVPAHAEARPRSLLESRRPAPVRRRVAVACLRGTSLRAVTVGVPSAAVAPASASLRGDVVDASPRSAAPQHWLLHEPVASTFVGPPPRPVCHAPKASRRPPSSCSPLLEGQ